MKDYYYILGISETASPEEIKKAYRKLSTKFHPDKNDGDEFFSSRFKEILEAYEVIGDPVKRIKYDEERILLSRNMTGANFTPEIELFTANKKEIEFDEEVTFTWKTINADKVTLKPFGVVPPIGQKTYKIKEFKKVDLRFELIAENTNINRIAKSSFELKNMTYFQLFDFYRGEIEKDFSLVKKIEDIPFPTTGENLTKEEENVNRRVIITVLIIFITLYILIAIFNGVHLDK